MTTYEILEQLPRPMSRKNFFLHSAAEDQSLNCEYELVDAISTLRSLCVGFWERNSLVVTASSGLDPGVLNGQRGTISFPERFHQPPRILLFTKDEAVMRQASSLGVDHVGADDLSAQVSEEKIQFDRVIATPEMLPTVLKLARVLGPRGLMPNVKTGTLTGDVVAAVSRARESVAYRVERGTSTVVAPVGPFSFTDSQLRANFCAAVEQLKADWAPFPRKQTKESRISTVSEIFLSPATNPELRLRVKKPKGF